MESSPTPLRTLEKSQRSRKIYDKTFPCKSIEQTHASEVNSSGPFNPLPATQCCVARGGISSEEMYSKYFPGKAEIERRSDFEDSVAVSLWRHTLHYIALRYSTVHYSTLLIHFLKMS
jgi:hypothetical protein